MTIRVLLVDDQPLLIVGLRGADAPKVVVLTTFDDDEYVYGALHAGASGSPAACVPMAPRLFGAWAGQHRHRHQPRKPIRHRRQERLGTDSGF